MSKQTTRRERPTRRYTDQPYLKALAGRPVASLEPGTVTHLTVAHDDWCDLLNGRGYCNCNPDIRLGKPSDADTHDQPR